MVFPAGQPRLSNTNNIASLTLNQIRFAGAGGGYAIFGNAITITNGIEATNSAGINVVSNNITLGSPTDFVVDVATGAKLFLGGTLSGTVGLIKNGGGTNTLGGGFSNTYLGATTVSNGVVELSKFGLQAAAIPHDLIVGNGSTGSTVRNLAGSEIADVGSVTVNRLSLWDLNDFSETIHALTLSGGTITTGTGILTLGSNITSLVSSTTSTVSGLLSLGGVTRTISVASGSASPDLLISAVVSDGSASAGITKTGTGQLTLSGANTYSGVTTIDGFVILANDSALGANGFSTNGTVCNANSFVLVQGVDIGNEFLTLSATNDFRSSGTASWAGPVTLTSDVFINVFGGTFTLSGAITGTGGVTKGQVGTLIYSGSGPNTYSGDTIVNTGILQLSKIPAAAGIVNGTLTIGDDLGGNDADVVRETIANQINSAVPITINSSGLLDLNNVSDAIGALTLNGGHLTTGTGVASLTGTITATSTNTSPSLIEGRVSMALTRTFDVSEGPVSPDLQVSAEVDGAGGITKTGAGEMSLTASNNYAGVTTVNSGFLRLENSFALGATNSGTIVNSGGVLGLLFGIDVGLEPLTLNGPGGFGIFGALSSSFGSNSWAGAVTLATDSSISVFTNNFLNLSGPISGAGGLRKIGPGTLIFSGSGANSYTGTTTVDEGFLLLGKVVADGSLHGPLVIGDNVGGGLSDVVRYLAGNQAASTVNVTVNGSGLLDLNGFSDTLNAITLVGGNIVTGLGTLTINNNMSATSDSVGGTATLTGFLALGSAIRTMTVTNGPSGVDFQLQAEVSGLGGITKIGNGFMVLADSNTFSGALTVNDGTLELLNDFSAGATTGGVTVNSNASLRLISSVQIGAESLVLNSTNISGALESISGSNSWAGNITLATNTIINVDVSDTLNLLGIISGSGTLTKIDTGTLIFSGPSANTYTNMTTVEAGTLLLSKPGINGAVPGELTIGDGSGGVNADVVRLATGSQIANNFPVHILSSGLLDLNDVVETTGSIDGTGRIDLGAGTLQEGNDNGTSRFTGLILGTGSVFKFGTGTWTLTGNNTYTGPTTVSAGTLAINGSQPQSPVTVNGSASLEGTGTVGDLFVFGSLLPGFNPDTVSSTFTCSNLTFTSTGDYFVDLTGPTPGLDYDQMILRGTNTLANSTLHVNPAFIQPVALGQQFTIINNDGAELVTGTFNGLPAGSPINVGGYSFVIGYGNDVVLTLTNIPASVITTSVTSGNGNHAIDPNDCNNIYIAISNAAPSQMVAVSATLSTTNDSVMITQPFSKYPDVPVNGRATNLTPFQVSTLPHFPCGSNIFLTLTLNAPTVGAFKIPVILRSGEPGPTPTRFDTSIVTNIPDTGTIESTNVVAGFAGPITKVGVSLYLTHTFDADLSITLISPDGVSVDLSSGNGGSADDFGINCSPDASRTTFDDSAATSITAGVAPFVGTFRPEGSLASFIGGTANGNWRLRITDANGGSLGALRCWSLFLYPPVCAAGSGYCLTCPGVFTNSISLADPAFTNRLFTTGVASSCDAPKSCPGVNSAPGPFHYDTFTFTNTGPNTCVNVGLDTACGSLFAAAYIDNFDTNSLCLNYLADIGAFTPGKSSFSFSVPLGATFVVVVYADTGVSCGSYQLAVSGLPCPPPTLAIDPAVAPQDVRVNWTTAAGGFNLEATPSLSPTSWATVTNEPLVNAGRYNVTNSSPPTNRFYRLHKP